MSEVLVALIGGGTALGVAWMAQAPHRARVREIHDVTTSELTNNHGSSIKDDIDGMAYAVNRLERAQDVDRERINTVLALAAIHHPDHAQMYLALRSDHDD